MTIYICRWDSIFICNPKDYLSATWSLVGTCGENRLNGPPNQSLLWKLKETKNDEQCRQSYLEVSQRPNTETAWTLGRIYESKLQSQEAATGWGPQTDVGKGTDSRKVKGNGR